MRSGLASVLHGSLPAAGLVRWWCVPRSQISGHSQVYTQDIAGDLRDVNQTARLRAPEQYLWSISKVLRHQVSGGTAVCEIKAFENDFSIVYYSLLLY